MTNLPKEVESAGALAIETRGLVKRFGGARALDGVDLTVPEGAVYLLVGPNGAGKTTTLKVLLDVVVPDAGSAKVLGLDTHDDGARVRACIGYVPEQHGAPYGWMRVGALMRYHAAYYRQWNAAYAAELARLFEVRPDARYDELSKGQQRRVQLLLALAQCTPVLVLDEPTDGLDPVMREQTLAALAEHLARFPTTLLISTHLVHEAERLADHVGVMQAGRLEVQVTRALLRSRLRSYRLELPEHWAGAPSLGDAVLRRNGREREQMWTIWGDETDVGRRLSAAGATIRQVEPLTLEEATVVLLGRRAEPHRAKVEPIEPVTAAV